MLEMFTDADPMRSADFRLPADGWRDVKNKTARRAQEGKVEDRQYFDADGKPTTLYRLVRKEPDWASSRIRDGEKAEAELERAKADLKRTQECLLYERNRLEDANDKLAAMESQEDPNHCALKSITDSEVRKVALSFWRRIYPCRNDYERELPDPTPVEFIAHMATALTWVDRPVPADKPAVAAPEKSYFALADELFELGGDAPAGEAPNLSEIYAILDKHLATTPSHSQQSVEE